MKKTAKKAGTAPATSTNSSYPHTVLSLFEDASNQLGDAIDGIHKQQDRLRVAEKAVSGCGLLMDDGNGLVDREDCESISGLLAELRGQLDVSIKLIGGIQSRATELSLENGRTR